SPDKQASVFVVRYRDEQTPSELRRSADGKLLATLRGPIAVDWDRQSIIRFSPDKQASVFVVGYQDEQTTSELRRSADGKLLATLSGPVVHVGVMSFSPDKQASVFVVRYRDGHSEVRDWYNPSDLIGLEIGLQDQIFVPKSQRMVVSYRDGRAYLLDIA